MEVGKKAITKMDLHCNLPAKSVHVKQYKHLSHFYVFIITKIFCYSLEMTVRMVLPVSDDRTLPHDDYKVADPNASHGRK